MPTSTRTDMVMDAIRRRLASRTLGPGDRLPSIRGLATQLGVSPSTVVEAYERLVAEGLVRSRRGSGFYVVGSGVAPLRLAGEGPSPDREVDPFWVSRQSLDSDPGVLKPGCGWLPADWLPADGFRRALRAMARADAPMLGEYASTRGSPALRRLLLARAAEEGLDIRPDQLLLTASGTAAIDLLVRFLLRPGDVVLVDDPCYFNFQALLRAHQVRIVGVPWTEAGPDLDAFGTVLEAERPRLYLTNSALHNPTGGSMTPRTAHRLLMAAAAHDLVIVEDDIFADLEPDPSPRLAVLDGLDRVIRIGSFSKTLSASVRCGYMAARADWVEGLIDLQVATAFGGPSPLATELIASVLASGTYRRYLAALRQRCAAARRSTTERLAPLGIEPWLAPRGGFFLWCRLPEGLDSADIARAALVDGVVLAPGDVFSVSHTASEYLRFNVAHSGDPRVVAAVRRAMAGTP